MIFPNLVVNDIIAAAVRTWAPVKVDEIQAYWRGWAELVEGRLEAAI
jgi:hypothetical protein